MATCMCTGACHKTGKCAHFSPGYLSELNYFVLAPPPLFDNIPSVKVCPDYTFVLNYYFSNKETAYDEAMKVINEI